MESPKQPQGQGGVPDIFGVTPHAPRLTPITVAAKWMAPCSLIESQLSAQGVGRHTHWGTGRKEPIYGSDHSMMPVGAVSPPCLTPLFPSLLCPGITTFGSLPSPRQGRGLPEERKEGTVMVCRQKKRENKILGDKLSLTINIHVNKPIQTQDRSFHRLWVLRI